MAGDRLPAPPRERKPALAALAALLVLVGALGTTVLVMQAGDRIEVIRITERVPQGQQIPESAMAPVLVAEADGVNYVPWSQRATVREELRAGTDLVAGAVLVGEMLTGEETLGRNEVIVGLSLQPGQFPSGLEPGDSVAAYWVGKPSGGEQEDGGAMRSVLVERARVEAIHSDDGALGNSSLPVTLRVNRSDAPGLARAASDGDVTLVIVPAGDTGSDD
ncbi:hypothetical protein GCM10009716_11800 [Streptomyces sodiiphilus]|uniref:SAF domain-containing protein n=1 Tax=Streptomyces sodiiphilus TaxID=226217 RepID=A0ABN2NYS7_9ACTN